MLLTYKRGTLNLTYDEALYSWPLRLQLTRHRLGWIHLNTILLLKCFCSELSQYYIKTQSETCVLKNLPLWLFWDKKQNKNPKGPSSSTRHKTYSTQNDSQPKDEYLCR